MVDAPEPQSVSPASAPTRLIERLPADLRHDIAAWTITGTALYYTLEMNLLPALLGGLLVYELVHILAGRMASPRISGSRAKLVAVAVLAAVVVMLLTVAVLAVVAYIRGGGGNLAPLFHKMAEIIETYRTVAPAWVVERLPADTDALKLELAAWLRSHADDLQLLGAQAGRGIAHLLIGMVIGAMVALQEAVPGEVLRPLARSLRARAAVLGSAFRRVVFAQVRIAGLNAAFTWIYLGVLLPLFGVELPFVKTLIVVTFICGLLPVLGNLISNTVIVIVSLNHSLGIAAASLSYLVVIHKLEYFLNARIIGSQIRTRAWEILLAMLVMEVAFGIAGVIAAPIAYAYLKDELSSRGLV